MKSLSKAELLVLIADHQKIISAARARVRYLERLEAERAASAKRKEMQKRLGLADERSPYKSLTLAERQAIQAKHFGAKAVLGKS